MLCRAAASSTPALPHHPRRAPPLRLRRCDLPTGRDGRVDLTLAARLVDVALSSLLERLAVDAPPAVVDVSLTVTAATGGAFFASGRARTGALTLTCDACGRSVALEAGLDAQLQFMTTPAAGAVADGAAADELPWPRSAASLDITPTVAAALGAGPSTTSCGDAACAAAASEGWAAVGTTGRAGGLGGGAAGARLAELKARLKK